MNEIKMIQKQVETFANERNWNQFHSPKNLSMALSIEAAELMEHFQWLSENESKNLEPAVQEQVKDEIADVQVYLARLADKLNIDIIEAVNQKMKKNAAKYPINMAYGNARKYSSYDSKRNDSPE